jgi:hypothetical protein
MQAPKTSRNTVNLLLDEAVLQVVHRSRNGCNFLIHGRHKIGQVPGRQREGTLEDSPEPLKVEETICI